MQNTVVRSAPPRMLIAEIDPAMLQLLPPRLNQGLPDIRWDHFVSVGLLRPLGGGNDFLNFPVMF